MIAAADSIAAGDATRSSQKASPSEPPFRLPKISWTADVIGKILIGLGAFGLLGFAGMSTSVRSGDDREGRPFFVHNIGLLHDRQNGLMLSAGAIALGAWLFLSKRGK